MTNQLPTIVSFWHGELSWLERLCITSFVALGHPFHLYAYGQIDGLPAGAQWRDATSILPQSEMFFYKGRHTPAVFADLFRLKLMEQNAGIWADCDVYALKPFTNLPPHVFGYENASGKPSSVNNAVFACPADSPLLEELLAVFDDTDFVPPWLPPLRRWEVRLRRLLGEKLKAQDIQFGATGPFPLTWYVRELGFEAEVQKREVFYPVLYEQVPELMAPGSRIAHYTTPESLAVHIWRSQLTKRGRAGLPAPHPDSALAELCAIHGMVV